MGEGNILQIKSKRELGKGDAVIFNRKGKRLILALALLNVFVFCLGFVDNPDPIQAQTDGILETAQSVQDSQETNNILPAAAILAGGGERGNGAEKNWETGLKRVACEVEGGVKLVRAKPKPIQVAAASVSRGGERQVKTVAMSVPTVDTSFKSYMDYRSITNRRSQQWKLQQQATTDEQGFRRIDGDYLVALGTYYAGSCGERFRVTLSSGKTITVMAGDIKSNRHTNDTRQYCPRSDGGGGMIEFIIDSPQMSKEARSRGDLSCLGLRGTVTSIEKIIP